MTPGRPCSTSLFAAAAALFAVSALAQTDAPYVRTYATTGATLRAGFVPAKTNVVLGEPLEVMFVVENLGPGRFGFMFGGDYRGIGRHDRFQIEAHDRNGTLLSDPHDRGMHFGGLMQRVDLAPGGPPFTNRILLSEFRVFREPGDYAIDCSFALSEPYARQSNAALPVVKTSFSLSLLERTPQEVARVLDEHAAKVESAGTNRAELTDALDRMAVFGQDDAVPRLARFAENGPVARRAAALSALSLVASESSIRVTARALRDPDPTIRSAAATALGAMQKDAATDALLAAFSREASPVREAVLRALGASKSERALPLADEALSNGDAALQQAAVDALVANGGSGAIALLTTQATTDNLLLRYQMLLTLGDKLRQPLDVDLLLPILMCRQEDHGGWLDTLRLFRMYTGNRAVPALLSGLDFDVGWSGRNRWILWEVEACANAPKFSYAHDPNSDGSAEAIEANLRTLSELHELAGPIATRPDWPKRKPVEPLRTDPPIDFTPVFKAVERGVEIQSGFFHLSKRRNGGNWKLTPSPAYEPLYQQAGVLRDVLQHPEQLAGAGLTAEEVQRIRQIPLPPAYPTDESVAFMAPYLESPPGPIRERVAQSMCDAVQRASQKHHAATVAFLEACRGTLNPDQLERLSKTTGR